MKEYKVTSNDWKLQPDPKRSQEDCDRMAAEGFRLVAATNVTGSGGGRVILYWEREVEALNKAELTIEAMKQLGMR